MIVSVTGADGMPLAEYGYQHHKSTKTASCHIEAKTGQRFCVSISPSVPFMDVGSHDDLLDGFAAPHTHGVLPTFTNENQVEGANPSGLHTIKKEEANDAPNLRSIPTIKITPPEEHSTSKLVPFQLVAWMYLDGREKAEHGVLAYLDQSIFEYEPTVRMESRLVADSDGTITERHWVFTDVGIDAVGNMLSNLDINKERSLMTEIKDNDLEELDDLMSNSALSGAGTIVVEIKRVAIMKRTPGFQPHFTAGEDERFESDDATKLGKDVTHTTELKGDGKGSGIAERVDVVHVTSVERNHGCYARFVFHYASRQKLLSLNLMDKDGKEIKKEDRHLTPTEQVAGNKRANVDFDESSETIEKRPKPVLFLARRQVPTSESDEDSE